MRRSLSIPPHIVNFEINTEYGKIKVVPVSALLEYYSMEEVQEWMYQECYLHLVEKKPLSSLGVCLGDCIRGIYDLWGKQMLFLRRVDM